MADEIEDRWGPLSPLSNVTQVGEAIASLLSALLADHEPRTEEGQRAVFVFGADIHRGVTGDSELDQTIRDSYLQFPDVPRAQWEVEIEYDAIVRVAQTLVESRERPDTQVAGPSRLEMLIRDQTRHSVFLQPVGTRTEHRMSSPTGEFVATVGSPSVELLMRCALRRSGNQRLEVFDRQRLIDFLRAREEKQPINDRVTVRVSAFRLLKEAAAAGVRSLRVEGYTGARTEELEQVATAFRVRLAYESSIVLAPVLDVDQLDAAPPQPTLIRQMRTRVEEFVDAIGRGVPTGLVGDHLLGKLAAVEEELCLRYLRAISAGDPFSAFMGYYHVLEYAMEEAWFEDLDDRVVAAGGKLQRPVGDIRSAASEAAMHLSCKEDDLKFNELRGLLAVIDRRIDLNGLAADLGRYMDGALDYFAKGKPHFASVEHLEFEAQDSASWSKLGFKLAKRIYAVRNAITHSKSSGRRYSPYTDDLELGREVPLVRIAAEQLLIPPDDRM